MRALREMVKTIDPLGIFFMETKIDCCSVAHVMKKLGFSFFFTIPPIGKKGGVAFCWRPNFRFTVLWDSKNIVHLDVEPGGDVPRFFCSLVYGPSVWRDKEEFWCKLQSLAPTVNSPWLCMGDFNYVVRQQEKQGGRRLQASGSRAGLLPFMQRFGFVDLGYFESKFTWCNKRLGLANIREWLDWGISNIPWRMAFSDAMIYHYPLVLSLFGNEQRAPKPFKFEIFWTHEASCFGVVVDA